MDVLSALDEILIHQRTDFAEQYLGFEMNNKYTLMNRDDQNLFFAVEETHCCTRYWCGPRRPFNMKILDASKNEVIHLKRPLRCASCCCPCCLQRIEVSAPPGNIIGTVEQKWSIIRPQFHVKNAQDVVELIIKGPLILNHICCRDVVYNLYSSDGKTKVGAISKSITGCGGWAREVYTSADTFGIDFPSDLPVETKAVLLGATFLIDFMYYETRKRRRG